MHSLDIKQVNQKDGNRFYQMTKNNSIVKVPSVTTIISKFEDKSFLTKWKARVGNKEAKAVGRAAANAGTNIHKANEVHFTGGKMKKPLTSDETTIQNRFMPILEMAKPLHLENKIIWTGVLDDKGVSVEAPLGMPVGFGGTFDGLLELDLAEFLMEDGKPVYLLPTPAPVLIDYKTKAKVQKKEWLIKACLQIAAYSAAGNQCSNGLYRINNGMILVATSKKLYPYYIPPSDILWYWGKFKQMVACYFYGKKFDWNSFINEAQGGELIGYTDVEGESIAEFVFEENPANNHLPELLSFRNKQKKV